MNLVEALTIIFSKDRCNRLTLPRLKSVGFLRVQNLNLKGVVNSPLLTSLKFNLRVAATWFQDISSFLLLC